MRGVIFLKHALCIVSTDNLGDFSESAPDHPWTTCREFACQKIRPSKSVLNIDCFLTSTCLGVLFRMTKERQSSKSHVDRSSDFNSLDQVASSSIGPCPKSECKPSGHKSMNAAVHLRGIIFTKLSQLQLQLVIWSI